jgi:DNA-binding NtrC family response regulator
MEGTQSLGQWSFLMRLSPDAVEGKLRMCAEKTKNRERILLINGKSETSLLVDLEQEGYEVTVCESPQKAWGLVYPIRPAVVILHLQHLSRKDIYSLQECHALANGAPVIIATDASRIDAFKKELGPVIPQFLSLPLEPNAVREILHGLESEESELGKQL